MKQQLLRGLCLLFVCLTTAFASSTMLTAQVLPHSPIGVDIPGVGTKYFRTLNEAFSATKKANKDGCTIHIPSGSYPLSDADSVRLNRRVNIFGSGAKGTGKTIVKGPIGLLQGADGSLIQGLKVAYNISRYKVSQNTGDNELIHNVSVRNCVVGGEIFLIGTENAIHNCIVYGAVKSGWPSAYGSKEYRGSISISNSYIKNANHLTNSTITNCIISSDYREPYSPDYFVNYSDNTKVSNCIIRFPALSESYFSDNGMVFENNIVLKLNSKTSIEALTQNGGKYLEEYEKLEDILEIFNRDGGKVDGNNYRLKEAIRSRFITSGGEAGIYGGAGFDDKMMSPLPRIVITEAPVKTNADGKLILKVRIDQN